MSFLHRECGPADVLAAVAAALSAVYGSVPREPLPEAFQQALDTLAPGRLPPRDIPEEA